jgi:DNA-binding transcriptional ArsR family regulator
MPYTRSAKPESMAEALRKFKAGLFQALANPTRIGIVELLRDEGEVSVSRICNQLEIEQANASQHLSVLRSRNIVVSQKAGNQAFYSLRDKRLGKVLDLMKAYFHAYLNESLDMLRKMEGDEP